MSSRSPGAITRLLAGALLAVLALDAAADDPGHPSPPFGFADVQAEARALASLPFREVECATGSWR